MANKHSDPARAGPADTAAIHGPRGWPRALPVVLFVAAVIAGDAVVRCFQRTSRLAQETHELAELSRTDPLTGLPNRRHVEEHLAAALSAARRHHQPLAVLFIDIDDFKQINDRFGYEVGDDVLRAVGARLRVTLRAEDLVGRWGGEEFLAVLSAADVAGALSGAERVRAAIASGAVAAGDDDPTVTVSVGCAAGGGEPAELIRDASRALRQAKHGGKNRVVAAQPSAD